MEASKEATLNAVVVLLASTLGDMPAHDADKIVEQCIGLITSQLDHPIEYAVPPKQGRPLKRGCNGESVEGGIVCCSVGR